MKLRRMILALTLVAFFVGVAHVAQTTETAGVRMTVAAEKFVGTLEKEKRAKATFDFDDKERTNWFFTPQQDQAKNPTRKGLPLVEMTDAQKKAALALVAAGTSAAGKSKATTIMSLEALLRELEKGGRLVRNPEWYFFTVFGTPSKTGKWGWRVEGHHLSLNFTVDGGKVVSATPAFFGANPATVLQGPRKGTRTLPEADDLAKELFRTLDEDQKKIAYQQKAFPEVEGQTPAPHPGEPKGLPAAKMTEMQRGLLLRLLQAYASRMPADVAEADMSEVHKAGLDQIRFAYSGGIEFGKPHRHRLQGPTFLI